ncbi:MAG: TlpA family protein disulfide reductase [Prevotella sp.]|jgi:thiol-disulfide isomerase/thioredoxin|nr:TlpA family protein disulfide reductase [Prevotella sp.]MCI1282586.1 TlpA family protein disulfide reductase [Prevotella sp.]
MKKLLTSLCALLICSAASAQDNFQMSGTFTDIKNDTLAVEFVKREPTKEIVSFNVPVDNKGEFHFGCQIKNAYKASMTLKSKKVEEFIFFVPEEKAVINGVFSEPYDWKISGSDFYQKLAKAEETRRPLLKEFDQSEAVYQQGLKAGGDEKALKEQREKTNIDINKRMGNLAMDYLRQHPNEEASVIFVGDGAFDDLGEEIKLLSPEVRNGRFKNFLDIRQTLSDRYMQAKNASQKAKETIEEGKPAPDFTLKDLKGNDFTLSSLFHKGKYVIVDFWGSWCTWCIKGFPKMKEYYAKFKDKLEIVGVDCYDKEDKWKEAVRKNGITWQQVRSADGTTEVTFGVKGYPHKVLISPEGKVLKMITGESDDFYNLLDVTLK